MSSVQDRMKGWFSRLALITGGVLLFETVSGLVIWLLPFSIPNQWMVVIHTIAGLAFLAPMCWYNLLHWKYYRKNTMSHIKVMGYGGVWSFIVLLISGVVLTWQGFFSARISYFWDSVHIIATFALLFFWMPHLVLIFLKDRKSGEGASDLIRVQKRYALNTVWITVVFLAVVGVLSVAYRGVKLNHSLPSDYSYQYGPDRPFAPSLASTETGTAIDPRVFAGSESCGTAGCHVNILNEWRVSAHRYSAMDAGFQAIQLNMAKQNGPESTRYCGGCHDPISLFSGTKNIFTDPKELTGLVGYQEGVSCLVCHAIKQTDIKGNAAYLISAPQRYLFEIEYQESKSESARVIRDFLIRAYPRHHVNSLSKHLFKAPEYCAACHKQFIDEEINNVGWVQLQNQYDNWRKSRWNHPDDPKKTIECRECHMYLVDSEDPASGDTSDYNRSAQDNKHRNHRFIAANQLMPAVLKLDGWQEQSALTEKWLQGKIEIPEIADKWTAGPAVSLELEGPNQVHPGEEIELRTIITSNKVGHDFPTGPLDIIQSWIQIQVKDEQGKVVYQTGMVDDKGFIQPGSFIFKAEPVDQYGNLVDRHNLWEMVGVRHRRALFPGFSDTADFRFYCPDFFGSQTSASAERPQDNIVRLKAPKNGKLVVEARLCYRKVDQFLLNFLFGEDSGLTSPVTNMSSVQHIISVVNPE